MIDANSIIQSLTTATATYHSAAFQTTTGSPVRGYQFDFLVTAYSVATTATAATTWTPSISVSSDSTNWNVWHQGKPLTATATSQGAEFTLEGGDPPSLPYVRVDMTLAGSGTTPSIAFQSDIRVLG